MSKNGLSFSIKSIIEENFGYLLIRNGLFGGEEIFRKGNRWSLIGGRTLKPLILGAIKVIET